eukprot:TRINITY_DN34058_c0_g1_i1.p1 TRINITY_DN34058_c0_g1~~TRINITY_DN34058_c0_g1_i1.p1  ORF type:complete len:477 (-),score=58.46 TRINITY_DN34058_c0_g1_i1:59-1489(-)
MGATRQNFWVSLLVSCLAEFVGTFLVVFAFGCNAIIGSEIWGITGVAFLYMSVDYALADVSGGHFNPAVTLSSAVTGKLPWCRVIPYLLAQTLAAICGGIGYASMLEMAVALKPGIDPMGESYTMLQAGLGELIYTTLLCFVRLSVATSSRHAGRDQFYGLATSLVLVAGCPGAGAVSGGGFFNPAVSLGINAAQVGASATNYYWFGTYLMFQLGGAMLAAVLFVASRPDDSSGPQSQSPIVSKLLCEFLGTYTLVVTFGFNLFGGSRYHTWSLGASWISLTYAIHACSGAHLNPAVTLAVVLGCRGKLSLVRCCLYMIVQVAGAFVAALTCLRLLDTRETIDPNVNLENNSVYFAALNEMIFTVLLCYVYLCVATSRKPLTQYFGFVVGLSAVAGGFTASSINGGTLNPAIGFGMYHCLPTETRNMKAVTTKAVAQFAAALISAVIFVLTHPSEQGIQRILEPKDVDGFVFASVK